MSRASVPPGPALGRALLCAALVGAAGAAPAAAVVGGRAVRPGASPAFASLGPCGGTLVTPTRVLTAAHCLAADDAQAPRLSVVVAGVERPVSRIALHPAYVRRYGRTDPGAYRDDVAIVELAAPATGVTPLPLARRTPRTVTVLGTGSTGTAAAGSAARGRPLREVGLRVVPDGVCTRRFARAGAAFRRARDARGQLCARDRDGRRPYGSPCFGDSGGPALAGGAVIGVVSWGDPDCARRRADPAVFTDVRRYRSFVTATGPVWAARASGPPVLEGTATVGATVRCVPAPWTVEPADRETILRVGRRAVHGDRVTLGTADRGATIACEVRGHTGGGDDRRLTLSRPVEG